MKVWSHHDTEVPRSRNRIMSNIWGNISISAFCAWVNYVTQASKIFFPIHTACDETLQLELSERIYERAQLLFNADRFRCWRKPRRKGNWSYFMCLVRLLELKRSPRGSGLRRRPSWSMVWASHRACMSVEHHAKNHESQQSWESTGVAGTYIVCFGFDSMLLYVSFLKYKELGHFSRGSFNINVRGVHVPRSIIALIAANTENVARALKYYIFKGDNEGERDPNRTGEAVSLMWFLEEVDVRFVLPFYCLNSNHSA